LPGQIGEKDVDELREAGFSDLEILQCVQVAAFFNYVNRLADGLGVEVERMKDEG
jgi:alkylhydroperoxidase family enzyme